MPELITLAAAMLLSFALGAWIARRVDRGLPLLPERVTPDPPRLIRRMKRDEEDVGD
jgi:hypothetical protein